MTRDTDTAAGTAAPALGWAWRVEDEILARAGDAVADNFCADRFLGQPGPVVGNDQTVATLALYRRASALIEATMERLADARSRALLAELLVFRALGATRFRLSGSERFPALLAEARRRAVPSAGGGAWLPPFPGGEFEVPFAGEVVRLESWALNVAATFFELQYHHSVSGGPDGPWIRPERGDVALDLGGCFGDTALGFAASVGPEGRVVSFEPLPLNVAVTRRNLARNPGLAARIEVVEHPTSDAAGRELPFRDLGPASPFGEGGAPLRTTTVDETVARLGLPRVDFLKMDIEGAELASLRGAAETIRRHRPKLAIACYHGWQIFELVRHLAEACPDHALHLGHHSMHHEETVLYAAPPERPGPRAA